MSIELIHRRVAIFCLNFFHPLSMGTADKLLSLYHLETSEGIKGPMLTYIGRAYARTNRKYMTSWLANIVMNPREIDVIRCLAYCSLRTVVHHDRDQPPSFLDCQNVDTVDLEFVQSYL